MSPLAVPIGGQLQSYFAYFTADRTLTGETLCYNWTIRDRCPPFPYRAQHPDVNGGVTLDYGYALNGTMPVRHG
jgi:hypothetical protein